MPYHATPIRISRWLRKHLGAFVSSVCVGAPLQQSRLFIEVLPRHEAEVIRKSGKVSRRGRGKNNTLGYETLYDAILDAQIIGSSFLYQVKPENLLFIFGQTLQSLHNAILVLPLDPALPGESEPFFTSHDSKQGDTLHERKPQHRAVVLCKIKHLDEFEKIFAGEKEETRRCPSRYQATWSELQELKKRFCDIRKHDTAPASSN